MAKYKISDNLILSSELNISFPINPENSDYVRFIQEVAEQGIGIVEGPDVFQPSYIELRGKEYPSRTEQFDMQYHDQVDGTTTWIDAIKEIKDKYPKTITGGTTIGPIPAWVQEEVDAYNASINT